MFGLCWWHPTKCVVASIFYHRFFFFFQFFCPLFGSRGERDSGASGRPPRALADGIVKALRVSAGRNIPRQGRLAPQLRVGLLGRRLRRILQPLLALLQPLDIGGGLARLLRRFLHGGPVLQQHLMLLQKYGVMQCRARLLLLLLLRLLGSPPRRPLDPRLNLCL